MQEVLPLTPFQEPLLFGIFECKDPVLTSYKPCSTSKEIHIFKIKNDFSAEKSTDLKNHFLQGE